jgi:hypothetical protein
MGYSIGHDNIFLTKNIAMQCMEYICLKAGGMLVNVTIKWGCMYSSAHALCVLVLAVLF